MSERIKQLDSLHNACQFRTDCRAAASERDAEYWKERAEKAEAALAEYKRISESGESLGGELEERVRRMEVEAEIARLREALHRISLGSQDSGTSKEYLGKEARAAIDAARKDAK